SFSLARCFFRAANHLSCVTTSWVIRFPFRHPRYSTVVFTIRVPVLSSIAHVRRGARPNLRGACRSHTARAPLGAGEWARAHLGPGGPHPDDVRGGVATCARARGG